MGSWFDASHSTPSESFYRGNLAITDPSKVSEDLIKLGIHSELN